MALLVEKDGLSGGGTGEQLLKKAALKGSSWSGFLALVFGVVECVYLFFDPIVVFATKKFAPLSFVARSFQ